jgi:fatty acid synthase subunit alpha
METNPYLTLEGCLEVAWMMGYIKHFDGRLKDSTFHMGWVDAKTGDPVDEQERPWKIREGHHESR